MPRYYFHFREGEELTLDDVGLELAGPESASHEALRGLADCMRDAMPNIAFREVIIEIADDRRNRLSVAKLVVEVTKPCPCVS